MFTVSGNECRHCVGVFFAPSYASSCLKEYILRDIVLLYFAYLMYIHIAVETIYRVVHGYQHLSQILCLCNLQS
jgi:hypothetical protein